jgi:hypothetical protein
MGVRDAHRDGGEHTEAGDGDHDDDVVGEGAGGERECPDLADHDRVGDAEQHLPDLAGGDRCGEPQGRAEFSQSGAGETHRGGRCWTKGLVASSSCPAGRGFA